MTRLWDDYDVLEKELANKIAWAIGSTLGEPYGRYSALPIRREATSAAQAILDTLRGTASLLKPPPTASTITPS